MRPAFRSPIGAANTTSATPTSTMEAKFGGMDVSEAKRLKTLEDENTRLKRLLADAMLDNAALKDLLGKKW
jgi:putative transposase